jgi:hypothetical protein
MDNLVLSLDFTGVAAQTGTGMGYLTTGFHTATVTSFKVYGEGEQARLYTYMLTDGTTHREAFDLTKAKAAIKGFLVASGLDEKKLGGAVQVPFHKLVGKTVQFYYTAPTLGSDGKPQKGGWPRYNWLTKAQFDAAQLTNGGTPAAEKPKSVAADLDLDDTPAAPVAETKPAKAAPAPKAEPAPAPAAKASSDDDFGFLSDDE